MKALLVYGLRTTTVFCANDEIAIGAMQACRDKDLDLPADMSIVGFDDIVFAQYTNPRLTTIHQPSHVIGVSTIMLMLGILSEEKPKVGRVILPYSLELRESAIAIIDMDSRCDIAALWPLIASETRPKFQIYGGLFKRSSNVFKPRSSGNPLPDLY